MDNILKRENISEPVNFEKLMETAFYIVLNLKTFKGHESFTRFFIGDQVEFANEIFDKLKGLSGVTDNSILQMDLVEMRDSLPINMKVIGCTLGEMAENFKIVTREVFKFFTFH